MKKERRVNMVKRALLVAVVFLAALVPVPMAEAICDGGRQRYVACVETTTACSYAISCSLKDCRTDEVIASWGYDMYLC